AMHEQQPAFAVHARQLAEPVPAAIDHLLVARTVLELVARPVDRRQGHRIEAVGIEQGRLVVISEDCHLAGAAHLVEALDRIRPVTDDIPQAEDFSNALRAYVVEHLAQGLEVGMDVAYQCSSHAPSLLRAMGKIIGNGRTIRPGRCGATEYSSLL